jgi:hypothetical protein
MKDLLKKNTLGSIKTRLAKSLIYYRTVPHSITQMAPCVALNNRKYITLKDKVNPRFVASDKISSSKQIPQFEVGDLVLALNLKERDLNGIMPRWCRS